jgi:predicted ATPase
MLVEAGGPPRLPLTLRAVLGARIDGLDEPARDAVGVASIIGIAFRDRDLRGLLGHPVAPATLDRLVDAALIVPVGDGTWRFRHPLVRDAAYAGILATRRRRLHARLADMLETRPGAGSVVTIAVHRAASGDAVRAVPMLDDAANAALAMGATAEAAGLWRTAADLAPDPADAGRFRDAATAALAAARTAGTG